MSSDLADFIAGVPKCELHLHIEGTLEPELRFELARRNGVTLPFADPAALRDSYAFTDLTSFLVTYYDAMRVLVTEADFYELARAYLAKAHSQRVRYAEIFFDPQAHTSRGVPFDTVIRGLRRALVDARTGYGIHAELILCFLRDFSAEYAMATLMESLPYKDWIVGVGLDSDERGHPPTKFAAVFERARAEGYFLTMHCDVDQDGATDHIRQCVDVIGVDRIDHGVNALDDESLLADITARGLGLTVCPISNRWVTDGLKADEVRRLLDLGVRVTVNSDDPAYFGGYVTENLLALDETSGLSTDDVVRLERNAFEIAWLGTSRKDSHLAELDEYAARHAPGA